MQLHSVTLVEQHCIRHRVRYCTLDQELFRTVSESLQVATLLEEYFSSGDLGEAAAELADMGEPELQHFLVKRAVTAALDKHNREREMTSVLLSSLYSEARVG